MFKKKWEVRVRLYAAPCEFVSDRVHDRYWTEKGALRVAQELNTISDTTNSLAFYNVRRLK